MKKFILLLIVNSLGLQFASVTAGPLEQGIIAFEKKDYLTATELWQTLAKEGDVRAQYNLALLLLKKHSRQQRLKAQKYLAMSRAEGLVDGYFLNIPDSDLELQSVKGTSKPINDALAWLRQQNQRGYTLQLATGKSRAHMESMRRDLLTRKQLAQSDNLYIHEVHSLEKQGENKKTSVRYILVYGVFDSYQQAKNEIGKLPQSIQKSSPWIRQFSILQSIVDNKQL